MVLVVAAMMETKVAVITVPVVIVSVLAVSSGNRGCRFRCLFSSGGGVFY